MGTLIGKDFINLYGSGITGATALKVYVYKGVHIWDDNADEFKLAPGETIGSDHEIATTEIPNGTNPIGVTCLLDDLPIGRFDLVWCDGTTYIESISFEKRADGMIIPIPE